MLGAPDLQLSQAGQLPAQPPVLLVQAGAPARMLQGCRCASADQLVQLRPSLDAFLSLQQRPEDVNSTVKAVVAAPKLQLGKAGGQVKVRIGLETWSSS